MLQQPRSVAVDLSNKNLGKLNSNSDVHCPQSQGQEGDFTLIRTVVDLDGGGVKKSIIFWRIALVDDPFRTHLRVRGVFKNLQKIYNGDLFQN